MPDQAWLHNLSPIIAEIGPLTLRWYGLSYIAGFAFAWLAIRWLGMRGLTPIPPDRALDAVVTPAIGALVGGRLGYVLLYQPALLTSFEPGFPWWGVLRLTEGGMASHGGLIGVCVGAWMVSRGIRTQSGQRVGVCPPLHVMDLGALVAPIGLGLGRLANFINGELLGKVVAAPGQPGPWWSVRYPQEVLTGHAPKLTVDQEFALQALAQRMLPGAESFREAYRRVLEQIQSGDDTTAEILRPMISARHPSQLYQALAEGLLLGVVVWCIWAKPRTRGVVGAWFGIVYGLGRIVTEQWRLPDDHLAVARWMGLTRGQWLSAALVVFCVALLVWAVRSGGPKFGGWMTRSDATSQPSA